jgi:predicted enzyme related to lactoylglutathione lyase
MAYSTLGAPDRFLDGKMACVTQTRTYPHGVPCWVDVEQPDVDAGARFYGDLFGWTFEDVAGGAYLIASLDGADVAGIGRGEGGRWSTYVAVDDADASAQAVRDAGGTVEGEPADAGPGGREARIADPSGARLRLWQARARPGAQVVNAPGSWNFSDLHTSDPAAAQSFYAPLFGWELEDMGFATIIRRPGYGDHLEATVDPGIRTRQAEVSAPPGFEDAIAWLARSAAGEPDHWHVTFAVGDRDAAAAAAERLGATIVASEDTQWTRTALIRDSQGAELTLSQFTPPGG